MKRKIETITIDWNNEKSIRDAEKAKSRLENKGYTLMRTAAGLSVSKLVYFP